MDATLPIGPLASLGYAYAVAALSVLAGLYAYVGSAKFHPTGELNPNFLDNLFTPAKQP